MSERYLWDRSGDPDPDVVAFERWAGQFALSPTPAVRVRAARTTRHRPPARRMLAPTIVAIATAAAVLLAIAWTRRRETVRGATPAVSAPEASSVEPPPAGGEPTPPKLPEPVHLGAAAAPDETNATQAASTEASPKPRRRRAPREANATPPTDDEIRAAIRAALIASDTAMTRCYRAAPEAKTGALVHMTLSVATTGKVTKATVVRHNVQNVPAGDRLARCLQKVVQGWTLAPRDVAGDEPAMFIKPDVSKLHDGP